MLEISKHRRRFELATEDELQAKELDKILAHHHLNRRELAVIISTVRLRPGFTLADFPVEPRAITARPMRKDEIKKNADKAENAILALTTWKKCMKKDGEEESDMEKMLASAINIFTELRREWLLAVGYPQEISGETLQKIVDATAAHMKAILKEQIATGKF